MGRTQKNSSFYHQTVVVGLLCGLVLVTSWPQAQAASLFATTAAFESRYPILPLGMTPTESGLTTELAFQDRLVRLSERYRAMTYVPYVYGGSKIGTRDECATCRECIVQGNVPPKHRLLTCPSCERCGMDCSHFMARLFREAGLAFPFAPTAELARLSPSDIRRFYGLVDLGSDLKNASAGDIILQTSHVVMLLGKNREGIYDFLHVTTVMSQNPTGGIELALGQPLPRMGGSVQRILRHVAFFGRSKIHSGGHFAVQGRRSAWDERRLRGAQF